MEFFANAMKFCLSCHQLSSNHHLTSDSHFCPHCGLSFGVRRCKSCKKKPSSPHDASHCVHCGGTSLTDSTGYFELGWTVKLLTAGIVFLAFRWIWRGLGAGTTITNSARSSFLTAYGFCVYWAVSLGFIYFFLGLFPGETGELMRKWYSGVIGFGWKLLKGIVGKTGTILYKLLLRLVEAGKH